MAQRANAEAILAAATRSDWDRQFLSRAQIHSWVLGEIAVAPFDPATTTLLEYVKGRMALAEQLRSQIAAQQRQQQQQSQQPIYQSQQSQQVQSPPRANAANGATQVPAYHNGTPQIQSHQPVQPVNQLAGPPVASSSASTKPASASTTQIIEIEDDEDDAAASSDAASSGPEDAMEFDLDDFVDTSAAGPNGLTVSRTPSPLPPAQLHHTAPTQSSQPPPAPTNSMFPFTNGQYGAQQLPFQGTQQQQQQPTVLNPAALYLNPQQAQSQHFQHQQQPQQYLQPGQMLASTSTISPAQLVNGQKRPRSNVEVVITPGRRHSPNSAATQSNNDPAKRQKTALGQSMSPPPQVTVNGLGQATQAAAAAAAPSPPRPVQSEADRIWDSIEKEISRHLKFANRAPNKSVRKLFDLMSAFVTEPEDASARNIRDAKATDLKVPARGRKAILETISAETNENFDTVFVVDPRATVLVAAWVKDLARIAKGKDKEPEDDLIKGQSRLVMEVLKKLPITLEVLTTLTGVGRHVRTVAASRLFDEVTRDLAATLVERWHRLVGQDQEKENEKANGKAGATRKRSETPTAAASSKDEAAPKRRRLSPAPSTEKQPVKPTTIKVESKTPSASINRSTATGPRPVPTATAKAAASAGGTKPLPTNKPVPPGKPLPAFAKRKPAPAKVAPKPAAAPAAAPAPAAFDPFATALSDMVRQKEESQGGMSLGAQVNMISNALNSTLPGGISSSNLVPRAGKKQKKSVRWEAPENLEKVKYVEVLVYGDEFGNEIASADYFNTTGESRIGEGEAEGVALASLAEEMDWEEPQLVDLCLSADFIENFVPYPNPDLMGEQKSELETQTEREAGVLAVTYFDDAEIPPCPTEPAAVVNEMPLPDSQITQMNLSWDMRKNDQVQMAIAAAQTRPFERANNWHASTNSTAGSQASAPLQHRLQGAQTPLPQTGLGGDNLSALLAKLSEGGLSIPPAQPQMQPQYHQSYHAWQ